MRGNNMRSRKTRILGLLSAVVLMAVVISATSLTASAVSNSDFTLRCRPGTDNSEAEPTYVTEGDDFDLQVKWLNRRGATGKWRVSWDTNDDNPVSARHSVDYHRRHDQQQRKSVLYSTINHTFQTIEDDLFEGPETFEAGMYWARKEGTSNSTSLYCAVEIRDDDPLKVTYTRLLNTPNQGSSFKAGETLKIGTYFNGSVQASDGSYLVLKFRDADDNVRHRRAYYSDSATRSVVGRTTWAVFTYTVQPGDLNSLDIAVNSGFRGDPIYGVYTNGTVSDVQPQEQGNVDPLKVWASDAVGNGVFAIDGLTGHPRITGIEVITSPEAPDAPWEVGEDSSSGDYEGSEYFDSWHGQTYRAGDEIEFRVAFDHPVAVSGDVGISLSLNGWRGANYKNSSGHIPFTVHANYRGRTYSSHLVFGYTVKASDLASDGFKVQNGGISDDGLTIYGFHGSGRIFNTSGKAVNPRFAGTTSSDRVDGRPYVENISIISTPAVDQTYTDGETIKVELDFSEEVDVEGAPLLPLEMYDSDSDTDGYRLLSYASGTGTDKVVLAYQVQEDDSDTNGVATRLNGFDFNIAGGTFKAKGTDVEFDSRFVGLVDDSDHKVDGSIGAPYITDIDITSLPGEDGTYGIGDKIEIEVSFNKDFSVSYPDNSDVSEDSSADSGLESSSSAVADETDQPVVLQTSPTLEVQVGEKFIRFPLTTTEASKLTFAYKVGVGDEDRDGISIGANVLASHDATIAGDIGNGTIRAAALDHDALTDDRSHRVDGRLLVPENSPAGTVVGDPDILSAPYSISGGDAAFFTVDSDTGELSTSETAESLDYETKSTYSFQYTGNSISRTITVHVTDVDEEGSITLNADSHRAGDTLVPTLTDPDGGVMNISWQWQASLHGGSWTNLPWGRAKDFRVDGDTATGLLRVKADYTDNFGSGNTVYSDFSRDRDIPYAWDTEITSSPESGNTYELGEVIEVLVKYSEHVQITGTPELELIIGDETVSASFDRIEGDRGDTYFQYTVQRSDYDSNGISVPAGPSIDLNGGEIVDFGGNAAKQGIATQLNDQSGHKVDARLSVPENSPKGTLVGIPGDFTGPYSISGEDAKSFFVDSLTGELSTEESLDYERQSSYSFQWTGGSESKHVTVLVTNVDEPGSIFLNASFHIDGDTLLPVLTDPDGGVGETRISWQWQASNQGGPWVDIPSGRNKGFTVGSGNANTLLRVKAVYTDNQGPDKVAYSVPSRDLVEPQIYETVITSSPASGDVYDIGEVIEVKVEFTEHVQAEGPVSLDLTIGDSTVEAILDRVESDGRVYFLYTVQTGDYDDNGVSVAAGPSIDLNGGRIADFGGNEATLVLTATEAIGDHSFHKVDARLKLRVDENSPAGTPVGIANPLGLEGPHSISGDDAASFSVDSTTGQLSTVELLDYETKSSYSLQWTGNGVTNDITVLVGNVNEPGSVTLNVTSHASGTQLVPTLTDPDGVASIETWQWEIAWTPGAWFDLPYGTGVKDFTVDGDAAQGQLRVKVLYVDSLGEGATLYSNVSSPVGGL